MNLVERLTELTQIPGPSGAERPIAEQLRARFAPYMDRVYIDNMGNVIGEKLSGKPNAKRVLLEAHMDEIGLVVTGSREGYLSFVALGNVDAQLLPGMRLRLLSNPPRTGLVSCLPPHVLSREEMEKPIAISDLVLNCGLTEQEAEEIVPGTPIVFDVEPVLLAENCFSSKALDNRASFAVLLGVLAQFTPAEIDLVVLASTQEELGVRGAIPALFGTAPDLCICLDVAFAKTPDTDWPLHLGRGTVITRGPVFNRALSDRLTAIAKAQGIAHQFEVIAGRSNTTADVAQISRHGVPTALLSIPLRYMHSPVEMINLSDVEAEIALLTAFLQEMQEVTVRV